MSNAIKVLIVDDEDQFRATTKRILDRRGFDAIVAANGEEAIDKMKEQPDVVILDVKMPGMDGHQALGEIKKLSPDTPVIMLTGHGGEASAKQALTEGACDYLGKPCAIDLLSAKIIHAHERVKAGGPLEEKKVKDVMIPITDYSTLGEDSTIKEAIEKLESSFFSRETTSRIMETGHRSILVFDDKDRVQGILAIADLLEGIMPAYLSAAKPSMADSMQYSPMFWSGLFTTQAKSLVNKRVRDVMSEAPLKIDENTNLMEIANLIYTEKQRRVAVTRQGKVVGVVREQELFFEMAKIILAA